MVTYNDPKVTHTPTFTSTYLTCLAISCVKLNLWVVVGGNQLQCKL